MFHVETLYISITPLLSGVGFHKLPLLFLITQDPSCHEYNILISVKKFITEHPKRSVILSEAKNLEEKITKQH